MFSTEDAPLLLSKECLNSEWTLKCKTKNGLFQYCLPGYYAKSHALDEILQTNSECTRIHAVGLPILDYASSSSALVLHSYALLARKSYPYVLRPTALCLQMSYPLSLNHQSAQRVTTPHRVTCYFPATSQCLIPKCYLLIGNAISCKNV